MSNKKTLLLLLMGLIFVLAFGLLSYNLAMLAGRGVGVIKSQYAGLKDFLHAPSTIAEKSSEQPTPAESVQTLLVHENDSSDSPITQLATSIQRFLFDFIHSSYFLVGLRIFSVISFAIVALRVSVTGTIRADDGLMLFTFAYVAAFTEKILQFFFEVFQV